MSESMEPAGRESPQKFGCTQELWRTVGLADLLFYGLVFMVPIAPFAIFGQNRAMRLALVVAGLLLIAQVWVAVARLLYAMARDRQLPRFLVLQVSVIVHYVVRGKSRNLLPHLVSPLLGGAILVAVVLNAKIWAQRVGGIWFAVGLLALAALYASGRKPAIAGLDAREAGSPAAATGAADLVAEGGTA